MQNDEDRMMDEDASKVAADELAAAVPDSSFSISHSSFPLPWLTYHHVRRDHVTDVAGESPIVDVYGYNQTLPVAEFHPVRDLSLSFQLTAMGQGTLYLKASDGEHDYIVALAANGDVELPRELKSGAAAAGKPLCGDRAIGRAVAGRPLVPVGHRWRGAAGPSLGCAGRGSAGRVAPFPWRATVCRCN